MAAHRSCQQCLLGEWYSCSLVLWQRYCFNTSALFVMLIWRLIVQFFIDSFGTRLLHFSHLNANVFTVLVQGKILLQIVSCGKLYLILFLVSLVLRLLCFVWWNKYSLNVFQWKQWVVDLYMFLKFAIFNCWLVYICKIVFLWLVYICTIIFLYSYTPRLWARTWRHKLLTKINVYIYF